jgi:ABC-type uncharacterized transport system substrate-binding protein
VTGSKGPQLRRRRVLSSLTAVGLAAPAAGLAQTNAGPHRIGVLTGLNEDDPENQRRIMALVRRLAELGWSSPHIKFDFRTTPDPARMRPLAAEIVSLSPDVIVVHSNAFLSSLREVNRGIPTVFVQVADPVGGGFVDNLARPGGGITGFSSLNSEIGGKWIELLKQAAPFVTRALVLFHRESASNRAFLKSAEGAAKVLDVQLTPTSVQGPKDIEAAVMSYNYSGGAGLVVMPSPVTGSNALLLGGLAARQRLPSVYPFRFFVSDGGGLMAYGVDTIDLYVRAADYVDRILRGDKPADLPVQEPTKFQLVINLRAAQAIGLVIPPMLLARADEVIE